MSESATRSIGDAPLSLKIQLGWGIGSLAMSTMFTATSLLLLRYLVDNVGITAALAGLLIGGAKIYDAVTDPVMGIISDKTKSPWGRRRPYLLLGGFLSAASLILLFNVAFVDGQTNRIFVAALALILNATGYTIFNVPYLAMPAEMTPDPHARTRIMSYRVGALAAGQLIASVLGPIVLAAYGGGLIGYSVMSIVLGAVIMLTAAIAFWGTRSAPATQRETATRQNLFGQIQSVIGNRPFMVLLGVKFTQLIGVATFYACLPFLFARALQVSDGVLGIYFLFQTIIVLISQPFWLFISRLAGKKICYYMASAIYAAVGVSWILASQGEPTLNLIARAIGTGFATGGLLLIGQSLLPDTITHDFHLTGLRREGVLAGLYTTVEKNAFALGPAAFGIILSASGYVKATTPDFVQPESAITALFLTITIVPAALAVTSAALLTFYNIDDKPS